MSKFKVGDRVRWGDLKATIMHVDARPCNLPYYLDLGDGDKCWANEHHLEKDEAPKEPQLYKVKGSFELVVETYYFVAENLAELEKMIEKELSLYEIISIDLIQETVFV